MSVVTTLIVAPASIPRLPAWERKVTVRGIDEVRIDRDEIMIHDYPCRSPVHNLLSYRPVAVLIRNIIAYYRIR